MPSVICIRKFKIHTGLIWTLNWSSFGDFLISSGADGNILLWGPSIDSSIFFFGKRQFVEIKIFQNWNYLTYTKSFYFRGTFRKINFSLNFNYFSVGTFLGKIFVCNIKFSDYLKRVFIEEIITLNGFTTEIKSCGFSKNGSLISIGTRDKKLWIWEKKKNTNFQCLFIIYEHESDIKETLWHPNFNFIASSSFDGFFRIFQKKNFQPILIKFLFLTNASIWSFEFDEDGNRIVYCSGKGEFCVLPHQISILKKEKKKKKKEKLFTMFFSLSRNPLLSLNFSQTNSIFLISGEEENLDLVKYSKIWIQKEKEKTLYGSSGAYFWINIERSVARSHCGSVYKCIWNPKNEKIFATCGEDMYVRIWSF